MTETPLQWWIKGELRAVDGATLGGFAPPSPDSSAYTTALVRDGKARWHSRHQRRLVRDAALLGLGEIPARTVLQIFEQTGHSNFGEGEGIVRLQIQRDPSGATALIGIPRPLGNQPATWTAMTAQFPHDGPTNAAGAKLAGRALFAKAHVVGSAAGVDEVVLLDEAGFLIEGSRANLFLVCADGELCVPDLERGGVAGTAREILCERAKPRVRHIAASEIRQARELIATNAVRGAAAITILDGNPVGNGRAGPGVRRLQSLLEDEGWR